MESAGSEKLKICHIPQAYTMSTPHIPLFSELPLRPGDPPNSAWGLWKDRGELGSLNWLSDDLVASSAKSEIKTGERVGLKYVMQNCGQELMMIYTDMTY